MFRGVQHLSLDAKGRVAVPARQRDRLQAQCAGQLYVTVDPQNPCLVIYPMPVWEELEQSIEALPGLKPEVQIYRRLMIGYGNELECDASGRVLIPPPLREYAGLDRKVVLVGQGRKLELWNEDTWTSQLSGWLETARSGHPLPEELLKLNF